MKPVWKKWLGGLSGVVAFSLFLAYMQALGPALPTAPPGNNPDLKNEKIYESSKVARVADLKFRELSEQLAKTHAKIDNVRESTPPKSKHKVVAANNHVTSQVPDMTITPEPNADYQPDPAPDNSYLDAPTWKTQRS